MADTSWPPSPHSKGDSSHDPQARDHLTHKQTQGPPSRPGGSSSCDGGSTAFAGVPVTRWQPLRAALLAAGSDAAASHRSAAEVWGMPGLDRRRARADGAMADAGPAARRAVASEPDTAADHHSHPPPGPSGHDTRPDARRPVRRGRAHATRPTRRRRLRRHLLDLDDLREAYDVLACRGRRRLTVLRAVLDARLPGFHPADSPSGARRAADSGRGRARASPYRSTRSTSAHRLPPRLGVSRRSDRHRIQRLGLPRRPERDRPRRRPLRSALTAAGWRVLSVTSATTAPTHAGAGTSATCSLEVAVAA